MKPSDVYRAVARATGESVQTIRALGFSPIPEPVVRFKRHSKRPRTKRQRQTARRRVQP